MHAQLATYAPSFAGFSLGHRVEENFIVDDVITHDGDSKFLLFERQLLDIEIIVNGHKPVDRQQLEAKADESRRIFVDERWRCFANSLDGLN